MVVVARTTCMPTCCLVQKGAASPCTWPPHAREGDRDFPARGVGSGGEVVALVDVRAPRARRDIHHLG